ncbi:MAG: signal peptide peptidase SppA [Deltaproteobacteria bacterium]|nr:signal peptide peptidase SppA [Deltaproteobacteria bacterium]MDQ3296365.1 signal peptide peptidase SppA [Myxococcota bacterium]
MRTAAVGALALGVLAGMFADIGHADDRSYAEEPTDGMALPTAALAGEHDGRVVATNPGGLPLVRGTELALALNIEDPDVATSAGQGFGAFLALAGGGGLLPRFGLGLGLEWLRPSRAHLEPDPGEPFRFTLGLGAALGDAAGLGVSWHHFHASGVLDGVDTFDLGLSMRWGRRLAFGATVRDLASHSIGGTPVQRRYEVETLVRPLGRDVLEVALGGRLGETRLDADGWIRMSARIARGVTFVGALESRTVHALVDTATGRVQDDGRDTRATVGFEVSFGSLGVTTLATGLRDDTGANHVLGGQLVLRSSSLGPASIMGPSDHIERLELSGKVGLRELTALVARLRSIARDSTAKALVITFDGVSGGWATLQELRDEILRVKAANKKVYAYMVSGTGRDYFVASAANKIYVDPAGGVRLVGMAGSTIYFRGAFDQLGVAPQFEKIAEYKSAPEQFTETGPSTTAAKMNNELFDSMWNQWIAQVASSRKLSHDELRAIVDGGPYNAGDLANRSSLPGKLVDAVAAPDKVSQLVLADLGRSLEVGSPTPERPDRWKRPGIAIIYVDGDITDGTSKSIPILGQSLAGGETLVQALASARANPAIGAIIIRIDSPGGSALASELVSREVFATRGVKPILCSMSDVAASGGYFIAAGCDVIFAKPMTVTGSIGIFYGKFDVSGLLAKLGITTDTYKRGKRADVESLYRPYTDEERGVLMAQLRYMYGRFVGAVAEGRGMKKDEVDAVGRGHVWTGEMAKQVKLVDRFGGLGEAIDEAKLRMGLSLDTRVQLHELPALPGSFFGTIGRLFGLSADPPVSVADLPVVRELVRGIPASVLVDPGAAQARLPFDLTWPE